MYVHLSFVGVERLPYPHCATPFPCSFRAPPSQWTGCSNNKGQIDGHVLKVDEPVEPSEVIYENLHLHWFWQYWGIFKAYCLTCGILVVSFLILQSLSVSVSDDPGPSASEATEDSGGSAYVAAIAVSLINGALPYTLKVITLKLEVHKDEGDVQTSILRKLMVARCLNTAVLMYVVTSHTAQFSKANLGQVQSILIADCFTTPVMRILNVYEHVMHRVVAPTKKTQAQMNVLFRGAYWNLAERYTDMVRKKNCFLLSNWDKCSKMPRPFAFSYLTPAPPSSRSRPSSLVYFTPP